MNGKIGTVARLVCAAAFAACAAPAAYAQRTRAPAGSGAGGVEIAQSDAAAAEAAAAIAATNIAAAIAFLAGRGAAAGPAALFTLGNLYFQAGDYAAARQAYESALAKAPAFRAARSNIGRALLLEGKAAEAVEVYSALLRGQGSTPDADTLLLLGHAMLLSGKSVSAESAYRQALLLRPGDFGALLGLGRCLQNQARNAELVALCRELLAQEPLRREFWALAASAAAAQGENIEAIIELECARRLGAADADMLASLADLYLAADLPGEARAAYEQALEAAPLGPERLVNMAEAFLRLGDFKYAERLLGEIDEGVLKADPAQRDALRAYLRARAEAAAAAGETEKVLERCSMWLAEFPMDAEALLLVAGLKRRAGDSAAAAAAYSAAAAVEGYEVRALLGHAQMELERRRYPQAARLLQEALSFNPDPSVARHIERLLRAAEANARAGE